MHPIFADTIFTWQLGLRKVFTASLSAKSDVLSLHICSYITNVTSDPNNTAQPTWNEIKWDTISHLPLCQYNKKGGCRYGKLRFWRVREFRKWEGRVSKHFLEMNTLFICNNTSQLWRVHHNNTSDQPNTWFTKVIPTPITTHIQNSAWGVKWV